MIIEANKTLVEQAKNRQQRKDRQKEVKRAEEKVSNERERERDCRDRVHVDPTVLVGKYDFAAKYYGIHSTTV